MISYETIRIKIRRAYMKRTAKWRSKYINNKNFTIISNNCWGGFIYQSYALEYYTPTVGLFFMADDYIKFVYNLRQYINCDLKFIKHKDSKWHEQLKDTHKYGPYPIGSLGDIEIHFLHYKNEQEAYSKWNKRCKRINWNRFLVKFNDQNGCTSEHLKKFNELNFKNKVCFISSHNQYDQDDNLIRIACPGDRIKASYEPFGESRKLNVNSVLNCL